MNGCRNETRTHYDTAASQVANRTLFLHPLPSCFLQRRSRGSSSPFPSLPPSFLFLYRPPHPSIRQTGTLRVQPCSCRKPHLRQERCTARPESSSPVLPCSSVKGSASSPPTFLLTLFSIYLVDVYTLLLPLHLLPPQCIRRLLLLHVQPAADWDTGVGRHLLSTVFSLHLIFQPSSLNKNSVQIV